jgi:CRP-like cAMP-binding protein
MARREDTENIDTDLEPSLRAVQFDKSFNAAAKPLLTESQERQLAGVATRVSLPPRSLVYREDAAADWIFISSEGSLKAYRELPSGKRRVAAFLFPGDVFGLAENGHYINTVQTISNATFYRIPTEALTAMLRRDPELQFRFLCKLTHELRQGQRHSIVLARRDAAGRLAMFLGMLEKHSAEHSQTGWIQLPMSRTDIAEYLGLSLESVSRATSALSRSGIVTFQGGHAAKVIDRARFEKLVSAL